jgi:protocatechuate 3,4-dioxygenase, alpha subunit
MRTPSQTVGPYFSLGLARRTQNELPGGDIVVRGRVLDGAGEGVNDALVELWHPDAGFGRCGTDDEGAFSVMVRWMPYYEAMVFARGLLKQVVTRMYLPGGDDEVLESLPQERRATLVASPEDDGSLRFDVHLQGERETVFFAL